MLNKLIQALLLLFFITLWATDQIPLTMDRFFMSTILILDFVALLSFFCFRKEKNIFLQNQYVRILYLFLFSFLILCFQAYIDYVIGNLGANNKFLWYQNSIVSKSLVLSSCALVSFLLGYSVLAKSKYTKSKNRNFVYNTKILEWVSAFLLLSFFVTIDMRYLGGGYGDVEKGIAAGFFGFLFECAVTGTIIVTSHNLCLKDNRDIAFLSYLKALKFTILLMLIYLSAVLFSGDRGPIIILLLTLFFGYVYITKRKIKKFTLLLFLISGSVFITLLGVVRSMSNDKSFFTNLEIALGSNLITLRSYPDSFSSSTIELAGSVRTIHIALAEVPSSFPHFNGLFAFQDVLLVFPGVKGAFIELVNLPSKFTSSAQFITFMDRGYFATWGAGTSAIADTYLDFGFIGVILIFFLFGCFLRKIEILIFSNSPTAIPILICAFLFFSYSIYLPRATLLYGFSKFLYVFVLVLIPLYLTKKKEVIL